MEIRWQTLLNQLLSKVGTEFNTERVSFGFTESVYLNTLKLVM